MTVALPSALIDLPIAHRALHDVSAQRPENSRAAIRAAVAAGYGIELDLQLSADGEAMVFHDYDLRRLTSMQDPIRGLTAAQAAAVPLLSGDGEGIPTLDEVVQIVNGAVPLLIELKDQDGGMGPDIGPLEAATVRALKGYDGDVAVMSFNPHAVAELARLAPDLPRGLTTGGFNPTGWPLSRQTCERLRQVPDFDKVQAGFISHDVTDLPRARVQALRAQGVPVLCWTVRSPSEEAEARHWADNVTFEGYLSPRPG